MSCECRRRSVACAVDVRAPLPLGRGTSRKGSAGAGPSRRPHPRCAESGSRASLFVDATSGQVGP